MKVTDSIIAEIITSHENSTVAATPADDALYMLAKEVKCWRSAGRRTISRLDAAKKETVWLDIGYALGALEHASGEASE